MIEKIVFGTLKPKSIPAKKHLKCPYCHSIGEYETDNNLETYCKNCGLIIDSPYPFSAGKRYNLLCDFIFEQKQACEMEKWKKKTK